MGRLLHFMLLLLRCDSCDAASLQSVSEAFFLLRSIIFFLIVPFACRVAFIL